MISSLHHADVDTYLVAYELGYRGQYHSILQALVRHYALNDWAVLVDTYGQSISRLIEPPLRYVSRA